MALTSRARKFAEVFAGNGTEAARTAGYAGSDTVLATQAGRLLRNAEVKKLIAAREKLELRPLVANRQARQAFWTQAMQDKDGNMFCRLKASELLGRSEADFTDKVEASGSVTVLVRVLGPEEDDSAEVPA